MRNLFLFKVTILLFINQSYSQALNICFYGEVNNPHEVCRYIQPNSFQSNSGAENAILRVLKPLGLKPNFILVPCAEINNCAAIVGKDGLRYIVYDNKFLSDIENSTNANWISISILAHELGHHLNGHTLIRANLPQARAEELEADEFSGFILAKLGANIEQAFAAMNKIEHPKLEYEIYSDHPSKQKRLDAIRKGFESATSLDKFAYGTAVAFYKKAVVDEFGGNKFGTNYCFYHCSFEDINFSIDFDKNKSSFTSIYRENGLFGCPLPTQSDQQLSGESNYFTYDKASGRVNLFYRITSGPDLGFIITFEGYVKGGSNVDGNFKIERPTLNNFSGFTLNIPLQIAKL
jgi:hypothetical protein